jgi:general secretion pathway protein N
MAAGAMRKTLLSCVVAAAVFTAANAWSAGRERPELRAALESANAPIEQMPPAPALQGAAAIPDPGPAAANADAPAPKGNPLWAIPLRALAATRERPLFSASRRPPPPVIPSAPDPAAHALPVAIKEAEPERPPLLLIGTAVSADRRIAILLNQTTKLVTQVKEGEQESGWRVTAVSLHSTVVERDERAVTLLLPRPENQGAQTEAATQASPLLIRARAR